MPSYTLSVNGAKHQVEAEADMPLLWVLRDLLGLVGTKYGCGIAQCGACTVHLNGRAVRSCVLSVAAVADGDVVTIEGLAGGTDLHPLQQAWIDVDVAQCGYCQAGQIMSGAALLAANTNPSDDDINAAMQGNYCRCGTYNRIRRAIKTASAHMTAQLPHERGLTDEALYYDATAAAHSGVNV